MTNGVIMASVTMDWLIHHTNCTETIHLLEGKIEQRIGDEWVKMRAGETCLIPIAAKHQTRNVGGVRAVMIIAYSAGARVYVADEK